MQKKSWIKKKNAKKTQNPAQKKRDIPESNKKEIKEMKVKRLLKSDFNSNTFLNIDAIFIPIVEMHKIVGWS